MGFVQFCVGIRNIICIYTSRLHSQEYFGYSLNIIVIEKGFSYLKKILPLRVFDVKLYHKSGNSLFYFM